MSEPPDAAAERVPDHRQHNDMALLGRSTLRRAEVLEALRGCPDFVGARALHAVLQAAGSTIGLTTVYRTLTALSAAGRTEIVHEPGGERLFRYRPGPGHRHYLVCRECGTSRPVDAAAVEEWAAEVALRSGFTEVRHTVELTGTCAACGPGSDGAA